MEKNEISKQLKKKLNDNGLKHFSVKGGKGTAWGWIEITRQDHESFTEEDQKTLYKIGITDNETCLSNWIGQELRVWEAKLNKPPQDKKLEELKDLFYKTAQTKEDMGTCCGGSGVYIFKGGKRIDFWKNNFAQSSYPLHATVQELESKFETNGYTLTVEDGWMD